VVKGGLALEVDGLTDTLKAVRGLQGALRSNTNTELRQAAKTCATAAVPILARSAEASGVPVARRVARSIRVKSDRLPVITIGGARRVGARGAPAGALVWGSEQGPKSSPNRFAVSPSRAGYWIAPAVAEFSKTGAVDAYKRAVYEILHAQGLT
jgi:hypothetical protein